jgi:hypothetical protein
MHRVDGVVRIDGVASATRPVKVAPLKKKEDHK